MKLVNYKGRCGEGAGVLTEDGKRIISVKEIPGAEKFTDVLSLITGADETVLSSLKAASANLGSSGIAAAEDIGSAELLPPIERPPHDVICVGVNYLDHGLETGEITDASLVRPDPIFFGKRALRIIGDGEEIEFHEDVDPCIDYEAELAVILGRRCRDVAESEAQDVIFGYSVFNDISSRTVQRKHIQWLRGKSLDTYTAMGPWIVTKDEVAFPPALGIRSRLNGELRQDSSTELLINDISKLIAVLSAGMTLEPGDIIATGTPAGVGMGMDPPAYMKRGDVIECEIDGIGKLTNRVK